jgi:hypothetical protein
LPKKVEVAAITGTLPPAEREERILMMAESPQKVLVATDCLSEGINLQEHFDAVVHYDLSWNPTRHEQREGRVDRFGQPKDKIRVVTYYGKDNQIDGIILDVLLRKHKQIRNSLGVSVPIPMDTNTVVEAIFEGLLLKEESGKSVDSQVETLLLPGFEDYLKPTKDELFTKWDNATAREKRSRTIFAQETIKVDEVARELNEAQKAIGSGADVERFVKNAVLAHKGIISDKEIVKIDLVPSNPAFQDAAGDEYQKFSAKFSLPIPDNTIYLSRTHPFVENLASFVFNSALDPLIDSTARRCGVIRTKAVTTRTTLILLRLRYHIITTKHNVENRLLAEDCEIMAFTGSPQNAVWIDNETAESILLATPDENVNSDQAKEFIRKVIDAMDFLNPHIEKTVNQRGEAILDAHKRVRLAARQTGVSHKVEPQLPPDVLGVYIYLPCI